MTIQRESGKINFECDGCGDLLRTYENDFSEAMETFKDEGWISRKLDGWVHVCPECQGNEVELAL